MARAKTLTLDRKRALELLLDKLRTTETGDNTDIDLILKYLEDFLNDPSISKGGSTKFMEFEIREEPNSFSRVYTLKWKKFLNSEV